jgi:ABC-type multidrug transport system ATPase subunit
MRQEVLVKIKNLSKDYGTQKVLCGINLQIKKNERLGIIGENGAGKTTLVEIICQTKIASSGTIKFNFSKNKQKTNVQKEIGVQFQDTGT